MFGHKKSKKINWKKLGKELNKEIVDAVYNATIAAVADVVVVSAFAGVKKLATSFRKVDTAKLETEAEPAKVEATTAAAQA